MRYKVIKPFRFYGLVRMPGQMIEMDIQQAARIRTMGLISPTEQAVAPPTERTKPPEPERAIKTPGEHRSKKSGKKKKD